MIISATCCPRGSLDLSASISGRRHCSGRSWQGWAYCDAILWILNNFCSLPKQPSRMIKNYFTTAWRNIRHNFVYSCINVFGLSLGICTCLVIFLISHYEFSTDAFHPGGNRIYRVVETLAIPGLRNLEKRASSPLDLAPAAAGKLTGVQTLAPYVLYSAKIAVPGSDDPHRQFDNGIAGSGRGPGLSSTIIAGPDYFRIFQYRWLAGDPATALAAPNKVVLTTAAARKYFGNLPPDQSIGRTLVFNDSLQVQVSGILKD